MRHHKFKYVKFQVVEFLKNDLWGALFVLALLGLGFLVILSGPLESKGLFIGKIVGLHQLQSEVPKPPKLVVELDSGQRVVLEGSQRVVRRYGSVVRVELRGSRYYFVEFVDE